MSHTPGFQTIDWDPLAPGMFDLLEDLHEWVATGRIQGIGMDEVQVSEAIQNMLNKVKGE